MEIKNFTVLGVWVLVRKFFLDRFKKITADTLGWLATIILHCATIPSMLALMAGLSDKTPSLDLVLFVWAGLLLLFSRSIILKDQLNTVTIGAGFMVQAVLMAFILFK